MAALKKIKEPERNIELVFETVKDRNTAIDLLYDDPRVNGALWELVDGMTIAVPESLEVVFKERKLKYSVRKV